MSPYFRLLCSTVPVEVFFTPSNAA
jgi:hypothetical protein